MKSTCTPFATVSATSTRSRGVKLRMVPSSPVDKEKPKSAERGVRTKLKTRLQKKSSSKPILAITDCNDENTFYVFVFVGASADVAKKKAYPSIWSLYKNGLLPRRLHFIGFSKSLMSKAELRSRCQKYMNIAYNEHERYEEFWRLNNFYVGSYQTRFDYDNLNKEINNIETATHSPHRIFYISLAGMFTEQVFQNIKTMSQGKSGWTRIVIEKPFARTSASYDKISQQLANSFREEDIYRIDQYLGRNIVRNILPFRFCNLLFSSTWNRKMIHNVAVTIKESGGIQGKGKFFNSYGIIRDVMQLHVLQLVSLIAMEKPVSTDPNDIRDEKVKLLKCVQPVRLEDVVLGQYVGDPSAVEGSEANIGFIDDPDVEPGSNTPTYCTAILRIKNERWDGVPFILTCGKALDDNESEIRIRYHDIPADIYGTREIHNELVIQIEPEESLYLNVVTKLPTSMEGVKSSRIHLESESNFQLLSNQTHEYDNIFTDIFKGKQTFFVRSDELAQGWRIFTPLLNQLESPDVQPLAYRFGSRGPPEAEEFIKKITNFPMEN